MSARCLVCGADVRQDDRVKAQLLRAAKAASGYKGAEALSIESADVCQTCFGKKRLRQPVTAPDGQVFPGLGKTSCRSCRESTGRPQWDDGSGCAGMVLKCPQIHIPGYKTATWNQQPAGWSL